VLTRILVVLWPKKKEEMPGNNLRKLLEAFDTPEDPVLAMKRRLVKRGVEGAIALAQSHGEDVDWEDWLFPCSSSFGDAKVLREGEGVCTKNCVSDHSFGYFFDFCAKFLDASA
jgi:hypothetical protein